MHTSPKKVSPITLRITQYKYVPIAYPPICGVSKWSLAADKTTEKSEGDLIYQADIGYNDEDMNEDDAIKIPDMEWRCDRCYYHCAPSAADLIVREVEKYNALQFSYRRSGCQNACLDGNSLKKHFEPWSATQLKKCVTISGKR